MGAYREVRKGECLSSIAKRYGFQKWKALYDHPSNAELKKKRKNPNVIFPGDQVVIPDKEPKEVEVATAKLHTFKVALPRAKVRVVLKDGKGQAFAGKKYILSAGGQDIEGQTGGDGLVEQPIDAEQLQWCVGVLRRRRGNGAHRHPIRISFLLTNSSMPNRPSSRPKPERLTPPNGSSMLSAPTMLTNTMPASILSATRLACSESVVNR